VLKQIISILQKEFALELRQKNIIFGLLLYLLSIVFLIYLLQPEPESLVWNSFIWLCSLFITVNTVAKSFLGEAKGRWYYYYTIHSAQTLLIAKFIYNGILMVLVSMLNLILFNFFLGYPAIHQTTFVLLFLLGSVSFSFLFTLLSSIVNKANNNPALLGVIGFPLVFPQLIAISDLSTSTFLPLLVKGWSGYLAAFIGLDIIIIALGILLYPLIWKE
jgi:heme exporter protein B